MTPTTYDFPNIKHLGNSDRESLENVLKAVRENHLSIQEEEFAVGFNTQSGYVYALVDTPEGFPEGFDLSVVSCFGQEVDFLVTDQDDGNEFFYDTLDEAVAHGKPEEEDGDADEDE